MSKVDNRQLVEKAILKMIENKQVSGAVWGVIENGIVTQGVAGTYGVTEKYGDQLLEVTSVFDLASLTKIIGTTTRIIQLIDQGKLTKSTKVSSVLPIYPSLNCDISQLLEHRSGLEADFINKEELTWEKISRYFKKVKLNDEPKAVVYSDIGYILLGLIIEEIDSQELAASFQQHVFVPLGMSQTTYYPEELKRIVPTEVQDDGKALVGQVHDRKARKLEGALGSAGLFSTLSDLLVFSQRIMNNELANGQPLFSEESLTLIRETNHQNRTLGWEWLTKTVQAKVLFHTGFTGTSIGIDCDKEKVLILLTNRVHPTREDHGFLAERKKMYQEYFLRS